jgi:hypothetical protein
MSVTQLNVQHFEKETSAFMSRRGGTLKMIDKALAEYERGVGADADESVANLYLLIKACDRYVKKSVGKKPYKAMFASSSSKLQQARLDGARALRQLALDEMIRLAPAMGKGLARFDARKADGPKGAGRALHDHYSGERSQYQANKLAANQAWTGKGVKSPSSSASPFSGSAVLGRFYQYKEMGKKDLEKLATAEQDLARQIRTLEDVPDDIAIYRLLGNFSGNWKVSYLNKIKRMQYLMVPGPDGLFYDGNDELVDMRDQYMYAMDKYGGLYAAPMANNDALEGLLRTEGKKGEYFNHSSFNAGKEVLCAGILLIKRGVLMYIDNNSGHYQPSELDLVEALETLRADGVSLTDVGISTYKSRKIEINMPYLQALPFIFNQSKSVAWDERLRVAAFGF